MGRYIGYGGGGGREVGGGSVLVFCLVLLYRKLFLFSSVLLTEWKLLVCYFNENYLYYFVIN